MTTGQFGIGKGRSLVLMSFIHRTNVVNNARLKHGHSYSFLLLLDLLLLPVWTHVSGLA